MRCLGALWPKSCPPPQTLAPRSHGLAEDAGKIRAPPLTLASVPAQATRGARPEPRRGASGRGRHRGRAHAAQEPATAASAQRGTRPRHLPARGSHRGCPARRAGARGPRRVARHRAMAARAARPPQRPTLDAGAGSWPGATRRLPLAAPRRPIRASLQSALFSDHPDRPGWRARRLERDRLSNPDLRQHRLRQNVLALGFRRVFGLSWMRS